MSYYHMRRSLFLHLRDNPLTRPVVLVRHKIKMGPIKKYLKEHGYETVDKVYTCCKEAKIEISLFAGSLLGIVRSGKFIEYDTDMDFAVVLDEAFSWGRLESALTNVGFQKVREYLKAGKVLEQAYRSGPLTFDVFGLEPLDERVVRFSYFTYLDGVAYSNAKGLSIKVIDLPKPDGIELLSIEGFQIPVFKNYEEILSVFYGPGWRIPDPSWKNGENMQMTEDEGLLITS